MIFPRTPKQVLPPQSDRKTKRSRGALVVFWCFLQKVGTGITNNPWIRLLARLKLLIVEQNHSTGWGQKSTGIPYIPTGQPIFPTGLFSRLFLILSLYLIEKERERIGESGIKPESVNPRVNTIAYFLIHGLEGHPRVNPWEPVDRFFFALQSLRWCFDPDPRVRGLFCLGGVQA